jgi:hypothetical protein
MRCAVMSLMLIAVALPAEDRFLLVADHDANTVFAVNPFNGARLEISGPTRGSGDQLIEPQGIAFDPNEDDIFYVVADFDGDPSVVEVEWGTGDRSLVSGEDRGDGDDFDDPRQIVLIDDGDYAVVADEDLHALIAVDLDDGDRFYFDDPSLFNSSALYRPRTLAREDNDDILVNRRVIDDGDPYALTQRVYEVDGFILDLILHAFDEDEDTERGPSGLFVEPNDDILACFIEFPAIIRYEVDGSGYVFDHEVVSAGDNYDEGDEGSGPDFDQLIDLVLSEEDEIFALDSDLPGVFEVDPDDGDRSILSSNTVGEGPLFTEPRVLCLGRDVPDFTPLDVARHLTDETPLSSVKEEQADINDDGVVDITDIVFMVNLGL